MTTLAKVLEATEQLSTDERAVLTELLQKREAARRREVMIAEIAESEREFAEGRAKPGTPQQIMDEILSCDEN